MRACGSKTLIAIVTSLVLAGCGAKTDSGEGQTPGTGGAKASGSGGAKATGGGSGSNLGSGGAPAAGASGGAGGSTDNGAGGASGGSAGAGAGGSGGAAGGAGGGAPASGDAGGTGGAGASDAAVSTDAPTGGDGGVFAVPPGMKNIFDGTTTEGWMGNPAVWKLNAANKSIEGITPESNGGTFFYTNDDYDDFRVVLTERMVATPNHLGVCFWGRRGGLGSNGCLDVIPPSGAIWDYGDGGQKPGGVGSANNNIKYTWHQVEILASAATGEILVAVNGKQTTKYTKAGRPRKGPIGLQAHAKASHQEYKDIWVEVNPKERRLLTVK